MAELLEIQALRAQCSQAVQAHRCGGAQQQRTLPGGGGTGRTTLASLGGGAFFLTTFLCAGFPLRAERGYTRRH